MNYFLHNIIGFNSDISKLKVHNEIKEKRNVMNYNLQQF